MKNLFEILFVLTITTGFLSLSSATDLVYTNSKVYGQLVTSSTMRWVKGPVKDAVVLGPNPSGSVSSSNTNKLNPLAQVICRVSHAGAKDIGLISVDESICNVEEEDLQMLATNTKYQTLTGSASRLVWTSWAVPNLPPTGAVAISEKPPKFIASNANHTLIGYLDQKLGGGTVVFPKVSQHSKTALILTEIEPRNYELYDVELKRDKSFKEEEVVLDEGHLKYDAEEWAGYGAGKQNFERAVIYPTDAYDYWGIGHLMVRGLTTFINLPSGWDPRTKTIEWGMQYVVTKQEKTMVVSAQLLPGTGVKWTLKGTKLNGEMNYWAHLRTFYDDNSSSNRYIEGIRKLIEVVDARVEFDKPYFLHNGTAVPEPTTTTTTTTTTTPKSTTTSTIRSTSINPKRSSDSEMLNDQHRSSSETLTLSSSSSRSLNSCKFFSLILGLIVLSIFPKNSI